MLFSEVFLKYLWNKSAFGENGHVLARKRTKKEESIGKMCYIFLKNLGGQPRQPWNQRFPVTTYEILNLFWLFLKMFWIKYVCKNLMLEKTFTVSTFWNIAAGMTVNTTRKHDRGITLLGTSKSKGRGPEIVQKIMRNMSETFQEYFRPRIKPIWGVRKK